jgi:hypothetical protein
LRLPPELRSRIWEYALGGHTLRTIYLGARRRSVPRMVPSTAERMYGLDLLRTCRQIYTETALLPYKTNTFSFSPQGSTRYHLSYLKLFQRAQIDKIQIEASDIGVDMYRLLSDVLEKNSLAFLPNLKHITVVYFKYQRVWGEVHGTAQIVEVEEGVDEVDIRNKLDALAASQHLTFTCGIREESLYTYRER